jgi:hypothetical protein
MMVKIYFLHFGRSFFFLCFGSFLEFLVSQERWAVVVLISPLTVISMRVFPLNFFDEFFDLEVAALFLHMISYIFLEFFSLMFHLFGQFEERFLVAAVGGPIAERGTVLLGNGVVVLFELFNLVVELFDGVVLVADEGFEVK